MPGMRCSDVFFFSHSFVFLDSGNRR